MKISETLEQSVREKNIADIRGELWSCLAVDMNMTGRFKESLDYVLKNGISETELYEADDGAEYATEPTKENFSSLGGLLRINFSRKKLDALKTIGRTLYPPQKEAEGSKKNQESQPERNSTKGETSGYISTITGLVMGSLGGIAIAAKLEAEVIGFISGGILGGAAGIFAGAIVGHMLFKEK